MPKLSLLICTIPSRQHLLRRLLDVLEPQLTDETELLIDSEPSGSIGEKRQRLLDACAGRWAACIDDDDMVSPSYCSSLLRALEADPDCVGFCVSKFELHVRQPDEIHDLCYDRFGERIGADGRVEYTRPINHLNPVRTDLARRVGFPPLNWGEDCQYAKGVRPLLRTCVYIDEPLYTYLYIPHRHRADETRNWQ